MYQFKRTIKKNVDLEVWDQIWTNNLLLLPEGSSSNLFMDVTEKEGKGKSLRDAEVLMTF